MRAQMTKTRSSHAKLRPSSDAAELRTAPLFEAMDTLQGLLSLRVRLVSVDTSTYSYDLTHSQAAPASMIAPLELCVNALTRPDASLSRPSLLIPEIYHLVMSVSLRRAAFV
jgi:hypothetical protein